MKIKATKEKAEEALAKLKQAGTVNFDGENGVFSVKCRKCRAVAEAIKNLMGRYLK